jgi:hypothetical protein
MFPMKINKQPSMLLQINKKPVQSVIPLNIYQTWYTLDLPPNMKENVEILKKQNPEFIHYLYDDAMCREFIKDNFDEDVLYSFDKLKPGAYKADLWRYCILYKKGGIYLDIKYKCLSHFKLIELTNKEYCVRDRWYKNNVGIYNALLCFKRNNDMLYKCIQNIIYNVKNNIYGYSELYISGPHLMSKFFSKEEIINLPLCFDGKYILFNNMPSLIVYNSYREEQYKSLSVHYEKMWRECDVYNYPTLQIKCSELISTSLPIIIHKWYPLVFNYVDSEHIEIKTVPIYFKSIQGYSGYVKNNELWFILHKSQSFFAIFDETMNLLRYSEFIEINKKANLCDYSIESIEALKWYKD